MMNNDLYGRILNTNYNRNDSGIMEGYSVGCPTVSELIEILSKLPGDYRVTCCGAESYLYLFTKDGFITIDSEQYLPC